MPNYIERIKSLGIQTTFHQKVMGHWKPAALRPTISLFAVVPENSEVLLWQKTAMLRALFAYAPMGKPHSMIATPRDGLYLRFVLYISLALLGT